MAQPGADPMGTRTVRHRDEAGIEFSRIVAFSDGVFAIAITLLVLTISVPENSADLGADLADQLGDFFAYGISFAVLGKFWISHHRFYGSLARFDNRLMGLNLLYLAWVALVPFTSELLGDYGETPDAVMLYAANLAAVSLTFAIQISYSYRKDLMRPEARALERRYAGPANFLLGAVFLVSIPVALLDTYVAQAMWLLVFVVGRRAADKLADVWG